MNIIVYG